MINRFCVMTFLVVLAALAQAQTFTSVFSFDGSDGAYLHTGRLAIDPTTGTLYGTTWEGGSWGVGGVFSVTTAGTETALHTFTDGPDGGYPDAPVVRDSKGDLYGTTTGGGDLNCSAGNGCGVVFKLDSTGNETVLHSFSGGTSDGCSPWQGLVRDKKGSLYGTTNYCGASGEGTIFKINATGNETILHSFAGGSSDGAYPEYGSMAIDRKGNLYGVTNAGGSSDQGTLYEYTSSGRFRVLHSFAGGTSDGCYPYGTPVLDGEGNLFGTTYSCGAKGYGTVWRVSSSGAETILHSFNVSRTDGDSPTGGVALDKNGHLYGLTELGGANPYYGVLYKISSSGKRLTILHSFDGSDGADPYGDEVLIGANGTLYGTTTLGGSYGDGTVWSYVP